MAIDIDRLKNIDWDSLAVEFGRRLDVRSGQKDRVLRIIRILEKYPKTDWDGWLLDLLCFEENYEVRMLAFRNVHAMSNLFNAVLEALKEIGTELRSDENWFHEGFQWRDFSFKCFCGQGCYWRIEQDGIVVFQTT